MSFDNSDNGDNFQQNAINISVQLYIECMCSVMEEIFFNTEYVHTQTDLNKFGTKPKVRPCQF